MAKILIAVLYIAAILVIGIMAGRKVKTADEFATADRNIPFWTNTFSMSSAWIGAGSTLGCASMCYAYGISGFYLAIGVGIGSILASVVFAKRIREENVTTIPELVRKGETGFLFPPKDASALAGAMQKLLALPQTEYAALCEGCVRFARERFSAAAHLRALTGIYEEAIAQKRAG